MAQPDPRLSGEDVAVDSSLPAQARARIEAERGKAEVEFTSAYRKLKGASRKVTLKKTEALLAAYVHHVFFAFAEEALNCGWPAETVRQKAATFLTLLTDRTFFLKHPCARLADRDTHRARFQDWALFAVRNSDSWLEFQKALVELADTNSRGTAELRGPKEQSPEAGKHGRQAEASAAAPAEPTRMRGTVTSPSAARRMEAYLQAKGIGLTDFATLAGTTDRTLRSFRKTGKVRRDIFDSIAKQMGTTKEELLKD